MALNNYDNLVKTVINYSHRDDIGTKMADFIRLAEVEMLSNPSAPLKMNESELVATTTASTTARELAFPDGVQSARKLSITISDDLYKVEYRTPDQMVIRSGKGIPYFFTVRANELEFDILPEEEYTVTFTYFSGFTPLTEDNQTNIVLNKYPNIYLYTCLRQVFLWSQDTEQAIIYGQEALSAIESANDAETQVRYLSQQQQTVNWAP